MMGLKIFFASILPALLTVACVAAGQKTNDKTDNKLIATTKAAREGDEMSMETAELPVELKSVGAQPTAKGGSYQVELRIHNPRPKVIKLDEPSVAYGGTSGALGKISNNLFEVTADGKAISYRGEMAKRAKPNRFIELKPGEDYRVVVDLGEAYPLPTNAREVVVKFSHMNHFSPDAFKMQSAPLKIELKR